MKYAVSLEICHIESEQEAKELAEKISSRLNDLNEDIYICVSSYEQLQKKKDYEPWQEQGLRCNYTQSGICAAKSPEK